MKGYTPTAREKDLIFVLAYPQITFSVSERVLINQERAQIMAGNYTYQQTPALEQKIQTSLADIKRTNWQFNNTDK